MLTVRANEGQKGQNPTGNQTGSVRKQTEKKGLKVFNALLTNVREDGDESAEAVNEETRLNKQTRKGKR